MPEEFSFLDAIPRSPVILCCPRLVAVRFDGNPVEFQLSSDRSMRYSPRMDGTSLVMEWQCMNCTRTVRASDPVLQPPSITQAPRCPVHNMPCSLVLDCMHQVRYFCCVSKPRATAEPELMVHGCSFNATSQHMIEDIVVAAPQHHRGPRYGC